MHTKRNLPGVSAALALRGHFCMTILLTSATLMVGSASMSTGVAVVSTLANLKVRRSAIV
jgi:hypothetical protein